MNSSDKEIKCGLRMMIFYCHCIIYSWKQVLPGSSAAYIIAQYEIQRNIIKICDILFTEDFDNLLGIW